MRYCGGGVGHLATRQCNRTLLTDKHTEVADEDLFLTAKPEPIENQDDGSEGEDSDKVGNCSGNASALQLRKN